MYVYSMEPNFDLIETGEISEMFKEQVFDIVFLHDIKIPKGASAATVRGVLIVKELNKYTLKHLSV